MSTAPKMNQIHMVPQPFQQQQSQHEGGGFQFQQQEQQQQQEQGQDQSGGFGAGDPNNTGNSGEGGASGSDAGNNSGIPDDLASFWNDGAEAEGGQTPAHGLSDPQAFLTSTLDGLSQFDHGNQILEAAQNGDAAGLNKALAANNRAVGQRMIQFVVKLMQASQSETMSQVNGALSSRLEARDTDSMLRQEFPNSANPAAFRQIRTIYDRALQITKGDPKAAMAMTHSMATVMAESFGRDTNVIPRQRKADYSDGVPVTLSNFV